ncbi:MAG: asparagine synthase-related protein, partial [Chloroflexota bacterium]
KLIDVNLTGWDGGTVLGGTLENYDRDVFYRDAANEVELVQRLYEGFCRKFTWPGLTESEAGTLFSDRSDVALRWAAFDSLRGELARTTRYPPRRRADHFYVAQHVRRSTQNLVVFARSAIEVRCPFFDYDLVAFVYSLPEHIRAAPDFIRCVITRRMPRLATVPYEKDDFLPHSSKLVRCPHATLRRAKNWINRCVLPLFPQRPRLYADYEDYLRTDLREWAEGILFDRRTLERGLFDPAAVRALWDRHLTGQELWTIGKIAPLMTIEMVLRSLHDDAPVDAWIPVPAEAERLPLDCYVNSGDG